MSDSIDDSVRPRTPIAPAHHKGSKGSSGAAAAAEDVTDSPPKWAAQLGKMIKKLSIRMKTMEDRVEGADPGGDDPDGSQDETQPNVDGRKDGDDGSDSTISQNIDSDVWEQESEIDLPPILEMASSPVGYYQRILAFQPDASVFTFRKPDHVRLLDGARLLDVPPECRPVRSAIKSKMLKQAHDAMYSVGLFVERFGSAIALALQAGQSPEKIARFVFGDLVAPVARIAANTCHIISLYTGELQEDRDLASFGLVLAAPKEGAAVAPIAQQLQDLRRSAAEKGVKDASRKTISSLVQQLRGSDRRASTSPAPYKQERRRRASGSATDAEGSWSVRGSGRGQRGRGQRARQPQQPRGVAGGGKQAAPSSREAAGAADV